MNYYEKYAYKFQKPLQILQEVNFETQNSLYKF